MAPTGHSKMTMRISPILAMGKALARCHTSIAMEDVRYGVSLEDRDMTPGDVARLVRALLAGIERGELDASPREVEFLSSIAEMLPWDSPAA